MSLTGGERFACVYRLRGDEKTARAMAEDLCVEQTVEFPLDLIEDGPIKSEVIGRVEDFQPAGDGLFATRVSFAVECVAGELTQLINVAFGNISLKPGHRLVRIELSPALAAQFPGPRFGIRDCGGNSRPRRGRSCAAPSSRWGSPRRSARSSPAVSRARGSISSRTITG
ncbi:MAG: hypothetical protein M5R36_05035 [Deltaproteobacteria bacterium]|nr:hypothetical protein [Deltaproteobacteria bacterium]